MLTQPGLEPIDYLVIGHLTNDLTPDGPRLGGTAAYAARTARAFGHRVGIVTAWGAEIETGLLEDIQIVNHLAENSTTFENISTPNGREQTIHHRAPSLDYYHIPELWRKTQIIHIAPVAGEVYPGLVNYFPDSDLYITPQGMYRAWDDQGVVSLGEWPEETVLLPRVRAAVLSQEDIREDSIHLDTLAQAAPILVVTDGIAGASLYREGKEEHFPAPSVEEVDPTGAGDIFAAVFFIQLTADKDPAAAVKFANQVAADSVTRHGLAGAPSPEELFEIPLPEVN